jgi:succinoglycan biosynthesis transport protein ExoP
VEQPSNYLIPNSDHPLPAELNARMPGTFARVPTVFAEEAEIDLWEYWRSIRKHLRLIVVIFLVTELGTFAFLLTRTPTYTSASTIRIEREAPQVLESKQQSGEPDNAIDSFYKTQYEMLRSRSLAARVIHDLGLENRTTFTGATKEPSLTGTASKWGWSLFQSKEPVAGQEILGAKPSYIDFYLASLKIRPVFNTRLVSIAFSSPDPSLAAEIANVHVREFIRQNYQEHAQTGAEAQHYLEGTLNEIEARVEKSEAALNRYRRQRGIVEFSLDGKNQLVSDRIADLNRAVVNAEAARISLGSDVHTIQGNDYNSLPAVTDSTLIQRLKEASAKLEGEYASLSNQFTLDYPPVAQLHAQLLEAQRREQEEVRKVTESIKARYNSAVERENELRREFEHEKDQAMALKDASLQDAVLSRDVETSRALYQSVLERIKMLGVASESQMTNITIVDPAELQTVPSSPKKELTLVLCGFLALLGGIGVAFVKEASDKGLKTADEVQSYLRFPNLATVVHFATPNTVDTQPTELLLTRLDENQELAVAGNQVTSARGLFSAAGEAYRAIRTGILLSRSERSPRTILFSSAIGGEGKSVTATNCALMFAQLDERVLLIDADLRRPHCHEILGRDSHPGLTEVLVGLQELDKAIQSTSSKGLFFLSAGVTPPNPSELLGSHKMRGILAAAASSFDHVLIDSPPILPVSDSVVLSTLVDGVVMVVSAQTAKDLVRDACSRLIYVGSKMLGVVLNNVDPQQGRSYAPYYTYFSKN